MKETQFTRQYMKNFDRQTGAISFKIPDPRNAMGQGQLTGSRFVDSITCCQGMFVALEWKILKDRRGFKITSVREGQLMTLEAVIAAGGIGSLMFGLYRGPKDKTVYIVSPFRWRMAVANANCKSIRVPEVFADCATTMYSAGSYRHWDIKPIQELINVARNRT